MWRVLSADTSQLEIKANSLFGNTEVPSRYGKTLERIAARRAAVELARKATGESRILRPREFSPLAPVCSKSRLILCSKIPKCLFNKKRRWREALLASSGD
jgi:hypothetical protein